MNVWASGPGCTLSVIAGDQAEMFRILAPALDEVTNWAPPGGPVTTLPLINPWPSKPHLTAPVLTLWLIQIALAWNVPPVGKSLGVGKLNWAPVFAASAQSTTYMSVEPM